MSADFSPLQMLLVTLAGWVNRHQQHVIEYLVEENRVLKEQVRGRRFRLTGARTLTSRSTGPLARIRSPRPVNAGVRRTWGVTDP
jgi:hypothetical protein